MHYFGQDVYTMEGAKAMALITRVEDVCSFIEVTDPDDKDRSTRKPRSAMFAFLEQWAAEHAHETAENEDPRDAFAGIDIEALGGEIVEV